MDKEPLVILTTRPLKCFLQTWAMTMTNLFLQYAAFIWPVCRQFAFYYPSFNMFYHWTHRGSSMGKCNFASSVPSSSCQCKHHDQVENNSKDSPSSGPFSSFPLRLRTSLDLQIPRREDNPYQVSKRDRWDWSAFDNHRGQEPEHRPRMVQQVRGHRSQQWHSSTSVQGDCQHRRMHQK